MTYQVLARKWRPRRFAEMVGQEHVVRALSNALATERLHHAYLFTGTRGVGKTTVARILAKALNCEAGLNAEPCGECASCREVDEGRFVDLIEVDAASRAKVDETRDLMDNVQYAPARGRYKVYLIDEVHMFSKPSFNALLKTLEEPPPHVKFLLATTDPQKLPVTVLSRCLQFHLRQLPESLIASHLAQLAQAESIEAEPAALASIGHAAQGSLRDALSLLDQAIAFGAGAVRDADVRDMLGVTDQDAIWRLLEALAAQDGVGLLACVETMATGAPDFDAVLAELLAALQRIAVVQVVPDAPLPEQVDAARLERLALTLSPEDVQLYYQIGVLGRRDMPYAINPRSGLEMVLLRMLAFTPGPQREGAAGARLRPADSKLPVESTARGEAPPDDEATPPDTATPTVESTRPDQSTPPDTATPPATLLPAEWPATLEALRLSGLARELASNAELVAHADSTVRLRIAPAHAQLRGARAEAAIARALRVHLGAKVALVMEVGERAGESPAEQRDREASERQAAAAETMRADPGVAAICDMFGATVDPNAVIPTDGTSN